MAPTMNKLSPTSRKPCTKLGPAAIPTTAMNIFSPTLFSTHREASGIRPNVGCLLRSQPKNNPAINAPPLVLRLMGTPPMWMDNAPNKPPIRIPNPTNIISVWWVGRSTYPICTAALSTSCLVPTTSMTSPASNLVCASTGISIPARLMLRMLTPCMNLCRRIFATVFPANVFFVTVTGNVSAGKSSNCASCTSSPIQSSSPITNSRRPLRTTSSPIFNTVFGATSRTTPCLRRRSTNRRLPSFWKYISRSITRRPCLNHSFSIL